jgi:putative membrane protein
MDSGWPESADQRNVSTGEKKEADAVLGVAPKTADFVKEVAGSDTFEIQSSQLAVSKTQGDVQAFANRMVKDHTKTSGELKSQAREASIPVPAEMTSLQQARSISCGASMDRILSSSISMIR